MPGNARGSAAAVLLMVVVITVALFARGAEATKRVAVVGSGAAGSAASYYLRKWSNESGVDVDIVMFEKNDRIGGRLAFARLCGDDVELGGGIFVAANQHCMNFSQTFNLTKKSMSSDGSRIGVWNGKEFIFQSSSYKILTIAKMLYQYGMAPYSVNKLATNFAKNFDRVYDMPPIDSVEKILHYLQMQNMVNISFIQAIENNGIQLQYAHDIINAMTRVNYGQDIDMNALGTLVAIAGSTFEAFSIVGGNVLLPVHLAQHSLANVRLNTKIVQITKKKSTMPATGRNSKKANASSTVYQLKSSPSSGAGGEEHLGDFDGVILAAPIGLSEIDFKNLPVATQAKDISSPYILLHVTLVVGEVNHSAFGFATPSDLPEFILTTNNTETPFLSIALKAQSDKTDQKTECRVYKIFSHGKMNDSLLATYFTTIKDVVRTNWHAYPKLSPRSTFHPISLDPRNGATSRGRSGHGDGDGNDEEGGGRLLYANAFELAFSTIESEIAMGKNVAALMIERFLEEEEAASPAAAQPKEARSRTSTASRDEL